MYKNYIPRPINTMSLFENRLSKEDNALINGITEALKERGKHGEDISFHLVQTLKQMGRYDLLSPCCRD